MNNSDYLKQLGSLALASRLRRLSDLFLSDVEKWYRIIDVGIAPRCLPVLLFVQDSGPIEIKEIARGLQLSHSAVSQLITLLTKEKLLTAMGSPSDGRAKVIHLTKKGTEFLARNNSIKGIVSAAVEEVIRESNSTILEEIEKVENTLQQKNFLPRLLDFEQRTSFECLPFKKEFLSELQALVLHIQQNEFNIPITLADQPDLIDPISFFRKDNGEFWVAVRKKVVLGSIGLLSIGNHDGVLRKMFVKNEARGIHPKVAKALLEILLDHAKKHGFKRILLGTTAKYKAAHAFYEKHGFERIMEQNLPEAFPRVSVDTIFYFKRL